MTTELTATVMILSKPTPADLYVYRGDSGRFRVTVTDPDGLPVDVSTATWTAEIRKGVDDAEVMATMTVAPVAGDVSSVDVILSGDQSALLVQSGVWDLQLSAGTEVQTLMAGKVVITRDVSR